MNDDDLISKLEKVDLSDIVIPNHQRRLGKALHSSGCFKESKIMAILKRTSPVGGAIAVAAVVAAVVFSIKLSTSVSAQQAGQKSQQTSVGIGTTGPSPFLQAMMERVHAFASLSLEEKLQQALAAKDLTRLTSDQYLSQNPGMAEMKPPRGNGKTLAELKLTYLQFTPSIGGTCIIGVDDTGLPMMGTGGGGGGVRRGSGGGSGGGGFGPSGPGNGAFGPVKSTGAGRGGILVGGNNTGSGSTAQTTTGFASNIVTVNGKEISVGGVSFTGSGSPVQTTTSIGSTSIGSKPFFVNGKEIKLPPGTDPNNVRIESIDGKVYVNGKEIEIPQ